MAVKIRLKRLGKVRVPQYRIVVVDSRKKRDGQVIEEIGHYRPKEEPSHIDVLSERAQYWLGVGAQPSETVTRILELTGDWQKFKGIDGAESTVKSAAARRDKLDIFNEALKEAESEPKAEAVTAPKKKDEPKATKTEQEPAAETDAEKADTEVEAKVEDKAAEPEVADEPVAEAEDKS
ncbi:30S ribosomal protein S16 [Nocardioides panacisoli]|uniref:30S ribosomal protein S16 n=1 Tax=Nocardioides panacisoli TaxID=627624 RepID=UPI001C62C629|nr:30S ribosomal protein S16 [Nocardioides panacisoli]QYJ04573.1 30S ribosomal protein S16 [Nocardioides panacisoli]